MNGPSDFASTADWHYDYKSSVIMWHFGLEKLTQYDFDEWGGKEHALTRIPGEVGEEVKGANGQLGVRTPA